MSDWYGSARSNYFRVKDETAFRNWASGRELGVRERSGSQMVKVFSIHSEDEYGGWPSFDSQLEEESGDGSIDLAAELSEFLEEGEIAILMEIGAQKLCYLTGVATAVDHTGEAVQVELDDIYEKAADAFGVPVKQITECSY